MEVTPQCVVALTWTLKDTLGEELHRLDLHLEPEDAFGDYDEHLVFLEPRERFPQELE